MFIVQSKQPDYCTSSFASNSCHTEYNGEVESALETIHAKGLLGGLSRGLRRVGSNLSELSACSHCDFDATQIELDFTSKRQQRVYVRIETPYGETGLLELGESTDEHVFRPTQHGCGNGIWKIAVVQDADMKETVLSTISVPIKGVGTLFFTIGDDLLPYLADKEFLNMSGACRKHRL